MQQRYNYAFFDEASKREIRRALIKGVSIPGYQVPFASREMPIGRGWGTGGLQITLAIIGPDDTLKVIDQGSDDSVNAVNIKKLVVDTTDVEVTDATEDATLIQSRHRIPEHPLDDGQILVLQVPTPEPLRSFEPSEAATKRLHAEADYTGAWLELFDQIVRYDAATTGADHPVQVFGRYVMAPSPIPRFDNLKLNQARHLTLLGAGREKKIYAVPPFTDVKPLDFEDYPFAVETFEGKCCRLCGAEAELLEFESGESFLAAEKEQRFTAAFLDIYMHGMSGMDAAKELRKTDADCLLIFTTTSTDHALEGFQVRALHYLVKPFSEEELSALLAEMLARLPRPESVLTVKVSGSDVRLCYRDIISAEHFAHRINIRTTALKTLVTRQSFKVFTEPLKKSPRFFAAAEA